MGVAHAGAVLTLANFTGEDDEVKQDKIDAIVKLGALKLIPLTDAEIEALEKAKQSEKTASDAKAKKESAILGADFDAMNKAPMIEFAEEWEIDLKGSTAEDIRTELNELKESLKSL